MTNEELSLMLTTADVKLWIAGKVIIFHDGDRSLFAKVTKGNSEHVEVALLENRRWIEATPQERTLILFEAKIRGLL